MTSWKEAEGYDAATTEGAGDAAKAAADAPDAAKEGDRKRSTGGSERKDDTRKDDAGAWRCDHGLRPFRSV